MGEQELMAYDLVHWFRRSDELPVVLLHGFTGSAASWQQAVEHMSATCVLALHLPGHHADAPVADGWLANIDWVIDAIAGQGIDCCELVGYSLGARTALGVIVRKPALVEDALLIGVHPGLNSDQQRAQRRAADARWLGILDREGIDGFVQQWEQLPVFAGQSAAVRAAQRPVRRGHDPAGLAASLTHMGLANMPDYRAQFRSTDKSVRLAVGEYDHKFHELARTLIAEPIRIPGCGHNPLAECPERVARLVGPMHQR